MVNNWVEAWLGGMVLMAWAVIYDTCGCGYPLCEECTDLMWFEYDWLNGVRPLGWQWKEE